MFFYGYFPFFDSNSYCFIKLLKGNWATDCNFTFVIIAIF